MKHRNLFALVLLLAAVPAFAAPRIVRLSHVNGNVQLDRSGQGIERAILNMPITEGMRLLSDGSDARAEVEFENGTTVRMAGPAEVVFRELGLASNNEDRSNAIEVVRGTAYFDVKLKDSEFRVLWNGDTLRVKENSRFRVEASDTRADAAVYKGELELQRGGERVEIGKNETLRLDRDERDRHFVARNITPSEFDQFDKDRENYLREYSRRETYRYSNSPYSYGMSDLSYYGQYVHLPSYGYVWRPYDVGIGWDPFSNGNWAYYPGAGWTWVSGYPWGWTPYRYGSWRYFNTIGWAWVPGGYSRWNSYPVVVGPPQHWRAPRPPERRPPAVGGMVPIPRGVGRPGGTLPGSTGGPVPIPSAGAVPRPGSTSTAPNVVEPRPSGGMVPVPRTRRIEDAPRSAPMAAPPRPVRPAEPPRSTGGMVPQPRIERAAPPPRMEAPRSRMEAPRSAPRMEAPRSAPRMESPRGDRGGGMVPVPRRSR
ncbi:MAG TPA: DUF6600 domain-containing protein [Clostridia bacterium]|nr:DUF6600 domain-containing protein [Clostridia bacterium]